MPQLKQYIRKTTLDRKTGEIINEEYTPDIDNPVITEDEAIERFICAWGNSTDLQEACIKIAAEAQMVAEKKAG